MNLFWLENRLTRLEPADLEGHGDADAVLLGQADERRDALLAVLALRGHRAHVRPVHDLGNLDHGQRLKMGKFERNIEIGVRTQREYACTACPIQARKIEFNISKS